MDEIAYRKKNRTEWIESFLVNLFRLIHKIDFQFSSLFFLKFSSLFFPVVSYKWGLRCTQRSLVSCSCVRRRRPVSSSRWYTQHTRSYKKNVKFQENARSIPLAAWIFHVKESLKKCSWTFFFWLPSSQYDVNRFARVVVVCCRVKPTWCLKEPQRRSSEILTKISSDFRVMFHVALGASWAIKFGVTHCWQMTRRMARKYCETLTLAGKFMCSAEKFSVFLYLLHL